MDTKKLYLGLAKVWVYRFKRQWYVKNLAPAHFEDRKIQWVDYTWSQELIFKTAKELRLYRVERLLKKPDLSKGG